MASHSVKLDNGFAPVVGHTPRFLILGSMPGVKSLTEKQYYAHPCNAFWPIMATLFGFDRTLAYPDRCDILRQSDVAIWDVLQACHRPGSLDSNIDNKTIVFNDFKTFLEQYNAISTLFFNGAKAEALFRKALPSLTDAQRASLTLQSLPSTSPAYAAMPYEQKFALWKKAICPLVD